LIGRALWIIRRRIDRTLDETMLAEASRVQAE
jgi:hypothetical protein